MELLEKYKISTSMKVLGITALSYLAAFAFQFGYLKHFSVSYRAIEIDLITMIISLLGISIVLYNIDILAAPFRGLHNNIRTNEPIDRYMRLLLRYLYLSFFVILFLVGIGASAPLYFLCLIVIAVSVLEPVIFLRRKVGFKSALVKMYKKHDEKSSTEKVESYAEKYAALTAIIFLLMTSSIFAGKYYAMTSANLYVVAQHDDISTLLIQKNGHMLVTKDFNMTTNHFEPGFEWRNIEDGLKLRDRVKVN